MVASFRCFDTLVDDVDQPRFELVTTVRGRTVNVWLDDGVLRGDGELLARLTRFAPSVPNDIVELSHLVRSAVGSDVTIRVMPARGPGAAEDGHRED